ncbi:MAG: Na+/H+ antiporter NhaC family protein, partial [Planctomycetota bacterium]
ALWRRSLCEGFYVRITLAVAFLFMTIGVVAKNGGLHGIGLWLQRFVRGPRSAQLCALASGLLLFFDDYGNRLVVGATMRSLCDAARVSREKLAYIVDSTASSVAGISLASSWITYEISQYQPMLTQIVNPDGTAYSAQQAFAAFADAIPFRFYCLFAMALVFLVAVLRRDFGPMLRAERRARREHKPFADGARLMVAADAGATEPGAGTPSRAINAVLPLLVLVLGALGMIGMIGAAGRDETLLWASIASLITAVLLTLGQRILPLGQITAVALRSTKALGLAVGILFFAWSFGHVCKDLGTGSFLTAIARGSMNAIALPLVLFLLAALIAFTTGTSFGTMAILVPNVVVLAHQIGTDTAFAGSAAAGGTALVLLCIGAVLEGSIFGLHCSPISDTTLLSSLGTQCDHLAHVTTQIPYALLAMATSVLCGYLPMVWLGPSWWPFSLAAGVAVMVTALLWFGRDPQHTATSTA